ncbi:MAG: HlyD family efflux transporter periplasmic adaptor subunit [Verrucomicrobia bacterium]|nr:HlyD family efflux transporter periplasmic adaptor subunit [Verrucomicrobiota bacterium]
MDVPISPGVRRRRRTRRWLLGGGVVAGLALATLGLSRLQPALPRVEKASLYLGTVQRGEMVRQVRGNGTLVPEQIQFVQAESDGRVERIFVQPGAAVTADTVLMELSNPELLQGTFDAEWQLKAAEAHLTQVRAQLENERLALQSALAALKADATQADLDARVNEELVKEKMVSSLETQRSRAKADALRERCGIEQQRLKTSGESSEAQLAVQQAEVERARALLARKRQQVAALRVQAGVAGVLQQIGDAAPLQVGQRVTPSATLAKIVEPTRLKAVLKIAETQVKDVQLGHKAEIDTRNGVVPGHVVRIDPAAQNGTVTVDVTLAGVLPKGARPDLSVDGVIELERLESVLYVGRPVQGQAESTVSLFKVAEGGKAAQRLIVRLGRSSVSVIEVVEGLQVGDQVILSDMAAWDGHERIRIE